MLDRCTRKTHPAYHRYGGRGITICARWLDGFRYFLADMGPRPDGKTLERIDGNGNYEPGNCTWATPREQQNNTSTNRLVQHDSEMLTIAELARRTGVKYNTLYSRLKIAGAI